ERLHPPGLRRRKIHRRETGRELDAGSRSGAAAPGPDRRGTPEKRDAALQPERYDPRNHRNGDGNGFRRGRRYDLHDKRIRTTMIFKGIPYLQTILTLLLCGTAFTARAQADSAEPA